MRKFIMMICILMAMVNSATAEFYRNIDPQTETHIDILVTYTQETIEKDFDGSLTMFKEYIDHEIVFLNMIYSLSGVTAGYFRLVGVVEYDTWTDYASTYGADLWCRVVYSDLSIAVSNTLTDYERLGMGGVAISGNNIRKKNDVTSSVFQHEITHSLGGLHNSSVTSPDFPRLAQDVLAFVEPENSDSEDLGGGRCDIMAYHSPKFPFISNANNTYGGIVWGVVGETNVVREINLKSFQFVADQEISQIPVTDVSTPSDTFPDVKMESITMTSLPKYDSHGKRLVYFPTNMIDAHNGMINIHPEGIQLADRPNCADPALNPRYYIMRAFNGTTWSEPFKMEKHVNSCTGQPWPKDPDPDVPQVDMTPIYMLLLN